MIQRYTREAGVRNLERELAKLCRKVLTDIVKGDEKSVEVTPERLEDYLGVPRHKHGLAEEEDQVGVVTGLAYTSVRWRSSAHRSAEDAGPWPHEDDWYAGRRDEGIDRRGCQFRAVEGARTLGSSLRGSKRWTSTFTFPRVRLPRTARPQASRWSHRSCRS